MREFKSLRPPNQQCLALTQRLLPEGLEGIRTREVFGSLCDDSAQWSSHCLRSSLADEAPSL